MSSPCKRCGQIKDWHGDEPKCPFAANDAFGENWNCGIINKVRDLCAEVFVYCDDQYYATLGIHDAEDDDGEFIGLALWVTWYKRRGATDAMYILDSHGPPRNPTYRELELIVKHLSVTTTPNPIKQ